MSSVDIRMRTANIIKSNFGIEQDVTEALFDIGLIREDVARRVCIRDDYLKKEHTCKKIDLKIHLAEQYSTSVSTIEKIVNEGNTRFP